MSTAPINHQKEIEKCLQYILEIAKTATSPISKLTLFMGFMKKEGIKRSNPYFYPRFPEMVRLLADSVEISGEDKARWIYVAKAQFVDDNDAIMKLEKDIEKAGQAVYNDRGQIIKFTGKDGIVKFEIGQNEQRKRGRPSKKSATRASIVENSADGTSDVHVEPVTSTTSEEKSSCPETSDKVEKTPGFRDLSVSMSTVAVQERTRGSRKRTMEDTSEFNGGGVENKKSIDTSHQNPMGNPETRDLEECSDPSPKRLRFSEDSKIDSGIVMEEDINESTVKENRRNYNTLTFLKAIKKMLKWMKKNRCENAEELRVEINGMIQKIKGDDKYLALSEYKIYHILEDGLACMTSDIFRKESTPKKKWLKSYDFTDYLERLCLICCSVLSLALIPRLVKAIEFRIMESKFEKGKVLAEDLVNAMKRMVHNLSNEYFI